MSKTIQLDRAFYSHYPDRKQESKEAREMLSRVEAKVLSMTHHLPTWKLLVLPMYLFFWPYCQLRMTTFGQKTDILQLRKKMIFWTGCQLSIFGLTMMLYEKIGRILQGHGYSSVPILRIGRRSHTACYGSMEFVSA